MAEQMIIKEYADKEKISIDKIYRIRDKFFVHHIPIYLISKQLHLHNTKTSRIISWFMAQMAHENRQINQLREPKQYWKTESEMIIPDYDKLTIEDLTGDEKIIYEKLN